MTDDREHDRQREREREPTLESAMADNPGRREFLAGASRVAMTAGLVGGYGGLVLVAGRYLYPARPPELRWQLVATVDSLAVGDSMTYQAPSGETVNVARQNETGGVEDFVALSSTCPHLGCQVHWEPHNDRFFCPCHNGTFDPSGVATGGPPGDAGQVLPRYPLRLEGNLLYIEVPVPSESLRAGEAAHADLRRPGLSAPGHDRCLGPTPAGEREERS